MSSTFISDRDAGLAGRSLRQLSSAVLPHSYQSIEDVPLVFSAELGRRGVIISKIYATSETTTGINLAMHAQMKQIGRISPGRYAFELDVASSDLPLLKFYKKALAEWRQRFPG